MSQYLQVGVFADTFKIKHIRQYKWWNERSKQTSPEWLPLLLWLTGIIGSYDAKKFQLGGQKLLHTATFPGRVLPHSVVDKVVVQKREVVVERYWPTAGLRGRLSGRKPPVVDEVLKDFVIVGFGLPAWSGAVPEDHFLAGSVAQTEVCHVEVDLFEHTALSTSSASPSSSPPKLPFCLPLSKWPPFSFIDLLARFLLPAPPPASPAVRAVFRWGWGGGGEGRWGCGGWGGPPQPTDGPFDEVDHVFQLIQGGLLHDVWNTQGEVRLSHQTAHTVSNKRKWVFCQIQPV